MNGDLNLSQIFEIQPDVLEQYRALGISLISDLPLFVDPFLLFHSDKAEYQACHDEISSISSSSGRNRKRLLIHH